MHGKEGKGLHLGCDCKEAHPSAGGSHQAKHFNTKQSIRIKVRHLLIKWHCHVLHMDTRDTHTRV